MSTTVENPFYLTGYHGPLYFCDRETETEQLIRLLKNNNNITLFALRRMGKTGLLYHVMEQLQKDKKIACLYLDIFPTQDLSQFTNQLATEIYKQFPTSKGIGKKISELITSLRPTISYDALSGTPEISLNFKQEKQYERTIQQLLEFLDTQNKPIVIAIDEFQQILEYPEKNIEATLRTIIQKLKNIRFVFCGSNQVIMNDLFNNTKRPFYASCQHVSLGSISTEKYIPFIQTHFINHKKQLSEECIHFILEWAKGHTYYVQYLCNQVFAQGGKKIDLEQVQLVCKEVMQRNESIYYQYRNLLTATQWHLLKAIAKDEMVYQPYAKEFINKHKLDSSSIVKRSLDSLLEKEMIYQETNMEGSYYAVYDKFLMRWMQWKL